jgi:pepF/M3 family oligoendopeptidase
MRWSLAELYTSFDSKEFLADLDFLDRSIEEFTGWAEENLTSPENAQTKVIAFLNYNVNISRLFTKLFAFSSLTKAVDARNEEASKYHSLLSVKSTELTKPGVMFQAFIRDLPDLEVVLNGSALLQEHRFYLEQIRERAKYMLSEKEEILISKMATTGSDAWTNLQNQVTATLKVDLRLDGKDQILPLPVVRNLAYSNDPAVRKTAFEAELAAYPKIEETSAAALNGIKGEVLTVTGMRGFESPLHDTLVKSRMDKETLDAMLTAIREYLPDFRRYYRRKGELLGHQNGLPFYDLFAPMGEVSRTFTYEEAMRYIVENFSTFSRKLGDFAENAYEKNWLDVEPRDGKRGGAFCSNLHPIGESRIMANFDGSFSNMTTLAHELGHGYHGANLKEETILNSRYPMPIAETASIFCETIVVNAALKEASKEEALSILESSISAAGQVIVDIYSRFLFETELFERRKDHPLSVKELKEIMIAAQKEAYGEGLDPEVLHPYMWLNKTHYYSAGLNYYNFPYAFGLLFAKGLYAEYLKRGESFVTEYDELLNATGKFNVRDVALRMDIDVTKPDFFRGSLELVKQDIDRFIELSKDV